MAEHTHSHGEDDNPHAHDHPHEHDDPHEHAHDEGHGHSHGLVDRSIMRSREGIKAVLISLAVLGVASIIQTLMFVGTDSVAVLADLVHNFGDAATAIPVGIAFYLRSFRAEKIAGLFVVFAIFVSACFALWQTIQRFIEPEQLSNLGLLAAAGVVGYLGNEIAARIRLRAGRRLASPALIADGNHARTDAFVSLGLVASAIGVGLGFELADPIVGLVITIVILKITWDSWHTVRRSEPGHVD